MYNSNLPDKFTEEVHGPSMTRTRPVYGSHVHGRVYGPCTRLFTACTDPVHGRTLPEHGHVHGRVPCTRSSLLPVYTALNVPCTRPCTGRVPYTAVYRAHGRLYGLCTRPSTAVYGPCTRPCTDRAYRREQPCTRSTAIVQGLFTGNTAANGRVHFP